ncbi:MAG: PAS domain S-box protein [Nitrospirae bacterium]|nr:PAS domain S-box protein [Nitrospirota bacterium]
MIDQIDDNRFYFKHDGSGENTPTEKSGKWKIMIVDDEEEVHEMTRLALKHFAYEGKSVEFVSAYSGSEAKRLIAENPDTAVMLLDVVMEDDHSGLFVTKYIREDLKNNFVRIILRTGQPGQAPKQDVIVQYDINDYREKTELTSDKFNLAMILALRTYRDIMTINDSKKGLEKAMLESLKTSSQLTTLLASIEDMICIKDMDERLVLTNGAFKEFTGLTDEDIIGKTYANFFPPAFAKKERESDREVFVTLKAVQIEQKLSSRAGDVYLETIKNPIFSEAGKVFGLVSVSRDITERKKLEIELRNSRDEYRLGFRAIVENSNDIITRIGSDYICRYVNPSCSLYLPQYKPEDIIGRHINQYYELGFNDEFIQCLIHMTRETIESNEKQEKEFYVDNTHFRAWFHAVSVPEVDTLNDVVAVIIIAHDITDRKKIENAMHKDLQLLTKAIETTQVGFTVTDNKGVIIYSNESEAIMHGYTVNELIGSDIEILAPKDLRKPLTQDQLKRLKRWKRESINMRKDESTFPVQLMSDVVMDDDGQLTAIVTSCEDITERRQMEEKIFRHSESLEATVKARTAELYKTFTELKQSQEQLIQSAKMASLGILTAGVAHEINNPLSFVYGNIGNLEKFVHKLFSLLNKYDTIESSSESKLEIESFKQEINFKYITERIDTLIVKTKEGANRIKKIVLDLKNFARLDIADLTDMDVNESLNTTLELLYHEYKNRVVIKREYGEIPKLQCYAAKVNQVFMNLLINSCQAIEGEGEVIIRTSADDETVNIAIIDNGKGIPPEIKDKIFDPFFTTKPVGVGTGLGLSISYKIIKEHGGEIIVESRPGKGTTFTVSIPLPKK